MYNAIHTETQDEDSSEIPGEFITTVRQIPAFFIDNAVEIVLLILGVLAGLFMAANVAGNVAGWATLRRVR